MKNDDKARLFFELQQLELFQAQVALEEETYNALQAKFLAIDPKSNVSFEFARVRGALEVLKQLKAVRETLIESHRSRIKNS